jgi:thymidylate synthase
MITCYNADNADDVWKMAAGALLDGRSACSQESRLGETRELLHCVLSIANPRARWVVSREPAINPAFAIVESLWILTGRNDAHLVNFWNPALPRFAGSGDTYDGAYGHRLRSQFNVDQIEAAYKTLAANPESRQVVMQIWDPRTDIPLSDGSPATPNVPCNVCSILKIRDGRLEWLQILRSNDVFRGLPYNIVQFTIMQEVMAGWLAVGLGTYNQISDSLHLYESDLQSFRIKDGIAISDCGTNLALSKDAFDNLLKLLMSYLERLAAKDLTKKEFDRICGDPKIPVGYRDLLLIAAADSARRRGWEHEQHKSGMQCQNPTLGKAWEAWVKRMRAEHGSVMQEIG